MLAKTRGKIMSSKANESAHIKKYRKKLEAQMNKEKQLLSSEAIAKTKNSIHHWIQTHSKERLDLKSKTIDLFDENKHPAALKSKFILKLATKLKNNQQKLSAPRKFNAKKI